MPLFSLRSVYFLSWTSLSDLPSPPSFPAQDIKSWAIHPGGPRILDAAAASIGIPLTSLRDSWDVLAQYGNMSSPTVLFILKRLIEQNSELPCVAISFGPGLAVECALIGHEQGTRSL